ncbi:PREDICTED: 28S ribosomal protein S9, mitochondrial-like isoform X6 [Polistes dominula]|uniref:28S ribosomal protein S9, mitochondrial-like isoform X6 n=1 Tax=Polistes dominula TaxID=743375 RepID=A0ABM1J5A9_POLDO|nr:PREDICTED: 28S ribosomal protein S9, mitochondrial-like isoform X6 [Polistes dominula]
MATPMFIRFSNFRNLLKINNNVLGISSNTIQCLESIFRLSSTQQSKTLTDQSGIEVSYTTKAMQTYMKRIQKHEELMEKELFEYEKGKRHLANMMGMDAEHFTQEDVDRSLEYLFPSGLYDPKARPLMKHPKEIFPPQKVAEFSADGKPIHPFFFMITPFYYETLHNIIEQFKNLDDLEDKFIKSTGTLPNENKMDPHESTWITKVQLEKLLLETLSDEQYEYFIKTMAKLLNHPLSKRVEEFIMKYRTKLTIDTKGCNFLPIMYTEDGKPYVKVFPCQRKSAIATVTVFGEGTGKITINGEDISYFKNMQSRQQMNARIN